MVLIKTGKRFTANPCFWISQRFEGWLVRYRFSAASRFGCDFHAFGELLLEISADFLGIEGQEGSARFEVLNEYLARGVGERSGDDGNRSDGYYLPDNRNRFQSAAPDCLRKDLRKRIAHVYRPGTAD